MLRIMKHLNAWSRTSGLFARVKKVMRRWLNLLTLLVGCFHIDASQSDGKEAVSFRQQIRPILSANCFKCHGPDPRSREADLRLAQFEAAVADRDGHAAIVPGKAESSEFIRRIFSTDDSERMPPLESNKHLTDEQRE